MKKYSLILIFCFFSLANGVAQTKPSPTQSKETGLWGYINYKTKEIVIDFQYQHAGYFSKELAIVKKDDLYGYIDMTGKLVLPIMYQKARGFNDNGYAPVMLDGKWGLIDKEGKANQKIQGYENLYNVYGSKTDYYVFQKELQGIINLEGEMLFPFRYNAIFPWSKDKETFVVMQNNKIGIAKIDGTEIIPPKYTSQNRKGFRFDGDIAYYSEGTHIPLHDGKKWGVLDANGKEIIPFDYDDIKLIDDKKDYGKFKFAIITKNGETTLVDKELKAVFHQPFEKIYGYYGNNSNILVIQQKDEIIFMNADTREITKETPKAVSSKYGIIYRASYEDKYGAISYNGKVIVPLEYEYLNQVNYDNKDIDNMLFTVDVRKEEKTRKGLYHTQKGLLIPTEYTSIFYIKSSDGTELFTCTNDEQKMALFNANGERLTEFEYNRINIDYKSKKIIATKGEKKAELDNKGVATWKD